MTKMATKEIAKAKKKPLVVVQQPSDTPEAATARMVLRPAANAAMTTNDYRLIKPVNADPDLNDLVAELQIQCDVVAKGNLGRAEEMLIAQAHSLDAIFTNLARRAHLRMDNLEVWDKVLRLALRAQSQCRATVETLAAVKNPPVVIAQQANVTSGPQQINNGVAREIQTKPKELMEQRDGERLDPGTASQTRAGDTEMAAVGAIDGAEKR